MAIVCVANFSLVGCRSYMWLSKDQKSPFGTMASPDSTADMCYVRLEGRISYCSRVYPRFLSTQEQARPRNAGHGEVAKQNDRCRSEIIIFERKAVHLACSCWMSKLTWTYRGNIASVATTARSCYTQFESQFRWNRNLWRLCRRVHTAVH